MEDCRCAGDDNRWLNGSERRPMTGSRRVRSTDAREKTKGERGRTKIAIQEPWNPAFLTSRRGPVHSARNVGRKGDPRQTAPGRIARKYCCYVIHWVFLSIGIRDLHRAPATISIDTRAKTVPPAPLLIKGERGEIDAPRRRLEGIETNKASTPIGDLRRPSNVSRLGPIRKRSASFRPER